MFRYLPHNNHVSNLPHFPKIQVYSQEEMLIQSFETWKKIFFSFLLNETSGVNYLIARSTTSLKHLIANFPHILRRYALRLENPMCNLGPLKKEVQVRVGHVITLWTVKHMFLPHSRTCRPQCSIVFRGSWCSYRETELPCTQMPAKH